MYEKKGDTEVHYAYDGDGNPRYIQTVDAYGTVEEGYLVTNTRGDVVAIVDNAGNVVAKYTYDAWGKLMSVTDASGNDIENVSGLGYYNSLRYRGYYYDGETCLYYLQSRYYDPQVKRFINADDASVLEEDQGSIIENNLFAYCLNNPVNMEDIEGDIAGALIFSKVVYTIVTGTITIYVTYDAGKKVKKVYKKIKKKIKQSKSNKKEKTKSKKKKKTSKQSGKERADDPPSWAKKEEYDKSKTAAQNVERVLNKKYGKNNWKKTTNSEYSKIKKWLQRSKGYK